MVSGREPAKRVSAEINYVEVILTSTRAEIALCMFRGDGGSRARDKTSSIELPRSMFMILMRSAKSLRLSLIISGSGCSAIWTEHIRCEARG